MLNFSVLLNCSLKWLYISSISFAIMSLSVVTNWIYCRAASAAIFSFNAYCNVISSSSWTLSCSFLFSVLTSSLNSAFFNFSFLDMVFLLSLSWEMTSSHATIASSAYSSLAIKWLISSSLFSGGFLSERTLSLYFRTLMSSSSSLAFLIMSSSS